MKQTRLRQSSSALIIDPRTGTEKEVLGLSRKCEICGKGQVSGNKVSHSNIHTKRKWNANIQSVRVNDHGTVRKMNVCTRCIKSGKVERAL